MESAPEDRLLAGEEATLAAGRELAAVLEPGMLVFLEGTLGAGKTTLVRGVLEGLGGDPLEVSSPTYGLVHAYPAGPGLLVHADLYRLADPREVDDLELQEWRRRGPLLVEWPQQAGGRLGPPDLLVVLEIPPGAEEISRWLRVRTRRGVPAPPVP